MLGTGIFRKIFSLPKSFSMEIMPRNNLLASFLGENLKRTLMAAAWHPHVGQQSHPEKPYGDLLARARVNPSYFGAPLA